MTDKATIALLLGDPSGIGPELIAKLLSRPTICQLANIYLIADKDEFIKGQQIADRKVSFIEASTFETADFNHQQPVLFDYKCDVKGRFTDAKATAEGGLYSLETLRYAFELTQIGKTDAICFAPLNKEALHLAGMKHQDELHWFAQQVNHHDYVCELNVLKELWTARVTSHIALKNVCAMITVERIVAAVELVDRALRQAGIKKPHISVAALNPHAGDGGNFGREEIEIITPAVKQAQTSGIDVKGPFPSDTIFLKGLAGQYDAVVTMYHDQGQIAMKLVGFDRGVTVMGGLPIPVTTPAHGTAFDIMGLGKANVSAMQHAFDLACTMGLSRRSQKPTQAPS